MDFDNLWEKALKFTEIVRTRIQILRTKEDTNVPYILLTESSINLGDTVVRKGVIKITSPSLIVPPNNPQFNGFDFKEEDPLDKNSLVNFFLVRGVHLPSFNYDNKTVSMDVFEGSLNKTVKHYEQQLQQEENINTGLIIGNEDSWPLSLLIFVCSQITKNANQDIKHLIDQYKEKRDL